MLTAYLGRIDFRSEVLVVDQGDRARGLTADEGPLSERGREPHDIILVGLGAALPIPGELHQLQATLQGTPGAILAYGAVLELSAAGADSASLRLAPAVPSMHRSP